MLQMAIDKKQMLNISGIKVELKEKIRGLKNKIRIENNLGLNESLNSFNVLSRKAPLIIKAIIEGILNVKKENPNNFENNTPI